MLLNRDVYNTSSLYHIYLYTKPRDHQRRSRGFVANRRCHCWRDGRRSLHGVTAHICC